MEKIYFDYASTTPVDAHVIEAMEPYWSEEFGNPSSPHGFGRATKKVVEEAREALARFIDAKSEEIIFTSGGTESNNHALIGIARRLKKSGNHLLVSKIEHHSVIEAANFLKSEDFRITWLPVDTQGCLDPQEVRRAITDKTILIAVMHASNEIGTVQDIPAIGKIAKEHKICFHVDAVQTAGHLPCSVKDLSCDTLALAAHKFYGPKGVGALYIRQGTPVENYLFGGDQERGRRASTQNVPGIVGLGKAIELCDRSMIEETNTQLSLRDQLLTEIPKRIPDVRVNGHLSHRLPNNAHFSFAGLESESLLMSLDMIGICASMGSACTAGALEPSHVLKAIGLSDELAFGSLRISIGRWTTPKHIDYLLEQLPDIVWRLRSSRV